MENLPFKPIIYEVFERQEASQKLVISQPTLP